MKTDCIIIDDEPMARKGMEEYVAATEFLQLKAVFANPIAALDAGVITSKDILLVDIGMPTLNGIELVKLLDPKPAVIFTTAYPQHAVEGFELNAADYLVKPIPYDRFLKAVMKAKGLLAKNIEEVSKISDDHFFIKSDNVIVKIFYADVLFAEALQNYVVIHTTQKKYITYLTFRSLEEHLDPARFIRTHKSYIVAAAKVDSIEGSDIRIGERHIPISRTLKDEVLDRLLKGKYLRR